MTPEQRAYNEGLICGTDLGDEDDCPYELYSEEYKNWLRGYEDAARLKWDNFR